MDIYESELLNALNESQYIVESDMVISEISIPKEINAADRARYAEIISRANKVLKDNGGSDQAKTTTTITNIILDALKFVIKGLTGAVIGLKVNAATPDLLKIKIKVNTKKGPKTIRFNPIRYMIGFVVDRLLNKLFETTVAPVRANSMIHNYREMIDSLQKIKRTCKDEKVEEMCDTLIERINKEIVKLSNKKGGNTDMDNIKEMVDSANFDLNCISEGKDIDFLAKADYITENTMNKLQKECKSCKNEANVKKETADDNDGEDDVDVDPEDESVIDVEDTDF